MFNEPEPTAFEQHVRYLLSRLAPHAETFMEGVDTGRIEELAFHLLKVVQRPSSADVVAELSRAARGPAEISEREELIEALKRARVSLQAFRDMAEGSSEEAWPVMLRIKAALKRVGVE